MKKFLLSCLIVAGTFALKAQSNIAVNEIRQYMSKGEQNGFEVVLNGSKPDDVKDALSKWTKKNKGKYVTEKKNPEIFLDNVTLPLVSANTVDIYVTITPLDKGSKMDMFVDLGGAFISSSAYGQQYTGMEAAIKKFANDLAIDATKDQLKSEEKVLKDLNGDLKDLTKKKEDYIKDIEKAKKEIQDREADIQKNDADQAAKQQQISIQQQIIETIKTKLNSMKF